MATFRTFHKNSKIPMIMPHAHPTSRTRNTPPTCPMPSSSLASGSAQPSPSIQHKLQIAHEVSGNAYKIRTSLYPCSHISTICP